MAFNKSGRIFINEISRMQKINFPGQEKFLAGKFLAEKHFMEELCLPVWILHGRALPVLEMKAMGR